MQNNVRSNTSVQRVMKAPEPVEKTADDAVLTEVWETMRPRLAECLKSVLRSTLFFTHATNIQKLTIPVFCRHGTSVLVEASTGSGKTLAFLLPILQRLLKTNEASIAASGLPVLTKEISAVILSPNRTLSRQTFTICRILVNGCEHNIRAIIWGDAKLSPEKELASYDKVPRGGGTVLVTTPEALSGMLRWCEKTKCRNAPRFAKNLTVIIDEADVILDQQRRTLSNGLDYVARSQRSAIWNRTEEPTSESAEKSKILFGLFGATVRSSAAVDVFLHERGLKAAAVPAAIKESSIATLDEGLDELAEEGVVPPKDCAAPEGDGPSTEHDGLVYSIIDEESTLINLQNCHMFVPARQSLSLLVHLLNKHPKKKHFVFFNNSETLEYVQELLELISQEDRRGVLWKLTPYGLHQGIPEATRSKRFQAFLQDEAGVLLSTDVCAFGIDVREVDYVLHFQPPADTRVYIHRIGRTGRMGCVGTSVLLLPLERREALKPFLNTLSTAFASEERRCAMNVFDATGIVSNLLASEPHLRELAIRAARSTMKTLKGEALAASLCSLGLNEDFAMQAMHLADEQAATSDALAKAAAQLVPAATKVEDTQAAGAPLAAAAAAGGKRKKRAHAAAEAGSAADATAVQDKKNKSGEVDKTASATGEAGAAPNGKRKKQPSSASSPAGSSATQTTSSAGQNKAIPAKTASAASEADAAPNGKRKKQRPSASSAAAAGSLATQATSPQGQSKAIPAKPASTASEADAAPNGKRKKQRPSAVLPAAAGSLAAQTPSSGNQSTAPAAKPARGPSGSVAKATPTTSEAVSLPPNRKRKEVEQSGKALPASSPAEADSTAAKAKKRRVAKKAGGKQSV